MGSPCKDCPDREIACWGHCEKYKAWVDKVHEQQAAEKEYMLKNRRDYIKSEECRWRNKRRRYK
jgi:hypothetical protein